LFNLRHFALRAAPTGGKGVNRSADLRIGMEIQHQPARRIGVRRSNGLAGRIFPDNNPNQFQTVGPYCCAAINTRLFSEEPLRRKIKFFVPLPLCC
jgi:hypothetical protein